MNALQARADLDLDFYIKTEGCYVVSDEYNNFVVAWRCNKDEPLKIDLNAEDLYIKYLQGHISCLIEIVHGVRYFCFERLNHPDKLKVHSAERVKHIIQAKE